MNLGDRYDLAKMLISQGVPLDEVSRRSGVSLAQAKLFFSQAHPGKADLSSLKRNRVSEEPWKTEVIKELCRPDKDDKP